MLVKLVVICVGMMFIVRFCCMKCLISDMWLILNGIWCGNLVVVKVLLVCWCVLLLYWKFISGSLVSVVSDSCLWLVSGCVGGSMVIIDFLVSR